MTVGVGIHWKYRVLSDVDLFAYADRLAEALLDLEATIPGLKDSAVSVDRAGRLLEIEVSAEGAQRDDAIKAGQAAVQAAIKASGTEVVPTDLATTALVGAG